MGPRHRLSQRLAVISAISGVVALAGCHREEPPPDIPNVSVSPVRLQTLSDSITGAGTFVPAVDAVQTIVAPEAARVAEIPPKEGDAVKAGDLLVRLDVSSVTQDIATAQAGVTQATLDVDTKQRAADQMQALLNQGLVPRVDADNAKIALNNAKTKLLQAQTALTATQTVDDHLAFKARFNGVVDKRFHNPDDFVNPQPEDPIIRVIDPARVQVAMTLSIAELGRVQMGQLASLTMVDGTSVPAAVTVRPLVTPPDATTAEIRLVPRAPVTQPLGTEVEVRLVFDERANALVIPRSAVLKDDDGLTYVLVAGDDHRAHRRDVKLGMQTPSLVQVVSGLSANEQVITSSLDVIGDNSAIK